MRIKKKKSLPVAYVLGQQNAAAEELGIWLAEPGQRRESELSRIAVLMAAARARDWAITEAEREVELAARTVRSVPLTEPARDELVALTRYLTRRES